MQTNNPDEKYLLQSVENALTLIDLLCEKQGLGVSEISKHMSLGKSTVFRLLATLQSKGYVVKDENTHYYLSWKLAGIGRSIMERSSLTHLIHPFLEELSERSEETAHLVIWHSDKEIIFIDKVLSPSTIRMDSMVGLTRLAHMTGTGKALLAFSPPDFIEQYCNSVPFIRQTQNTISSKEQLCAELDSVRRNGYACDAEESEIGLTCFAVPILSMGNAIAAISISGPTNRMVNNQHFFIQLLKSTSKVIQSSI